MRPPLRCVWQFQLVYNHGRKIICPGFVLFYLERTPDVRVAFVASRKVGGAVQRNRAKRVLRAAIADVLREQPDALTGWTVLVARREILEWSSVRAAEMLRRLIGEVSKREPGSPARGST